MDKEDLDGILQNIIEIAEHLGDDPSQAIRYVILSYNRMNRIPIAKEAGLGGLAGVITKEPEQLQIPVPKEVDEEIKDITAHLRDRILYTGAVFVYSKVPNKKTDFWVVSQHGLIDRFLDSYQRLLMQQMPSDIINDFAEVLSFIDDGGLLKPHEESSHVLVRNNMAVCDVAVNGDSSPVSFLRYQCKTSQIDGWKRQFEAEWYAAVDKGLCHEIINYLKENPEEAFHLFNGMLHLSEDGKHVRFACDTEFKEQRVPYTPDRTGNLYICDAKQIKPQGGQRRTAFDSRTKGMELVRYVPQD